MARRLRRGRSANIEMIDRRQFDEILNSEGAVLVVLWSDDVDYGPFLQAVTKVHEERKNDFRLCGIEVDAVSDLLDEYRVNKGYKAHDMDQLPGLIFYRDGYMVTSFNPTMSHPDPRTVGNSIERQFRRFLSIFLDYDPEKVTKNWG